MSPLRGQTSLYAFPTVNQPSAVCHVAGSAHAIISVLISLMMIIDYFSQLWGTQPGSQMAGGQETQSGGDSGGKKGEEVFQASHRDPEARGQSQRWLCAGPVPSRALRMAWLWVTARGHGGLPRGCNGP